MEQDNNPFCPDRFGLKGVQPETVIRKKNPVGGSILIKDFHMIATHVIIENLVDNFL